MKMHFSNSICLAGAIGVLAVGCSNEQPDSHGSATPEVRGEPIQTLAQTEEPLTEKPAVEEPESLPVASGETEPPPVDLEANSDLIVEEELPEEEMAATEVAAVPREVIQSDGRDYMSVGFDYLASYEFEVTDDLLEAEEGSVELTEKTNSMIPDNVRKLNASSVAVKGYMLPLKVEQGQVTEFLLMRDQSMCCFGAVPKINEWVSVKTIGSGVKAIMDEPVTIFGKLHVGEIRENGYLVGIYRMDGEKLAGPLDL